MCHISFDFQLQLTLIHLQESLLDHKIFSQLSHSLIRLDFTDLLLKMNVCVSVMSTCSRWRLLALAVEQSLTHINFLQVE